MFRKSHHGVLLSDIIKSSGARTSSPYPTCESSREKTVKANWRILACKKIRSHTVIQSRYWAKDFSVRKIHKYHCKRGITWDQVYRKYNFYLTSPTNETTAVRKQPRHVCFTSVSPNCKLSCFSHSARCKSSWRWPVDKQLTVLQHRLTPFVIK